MSKAPKKTGDSDPDVSSTSNGDPTLAQERVLAAYLEHPNAAAVARALHVSERNVRRILKRFAVPLAEMSRERDQERLLRAEAREAKVQAWADTSLDESLARLDALAGSAKDATALRAIKMKIALALREPRSTSLPSILDRGLEHVERGLAARLYAIETTATQEEDVDEDDA